MADLIFDKRSLFINPYNFVAQGTAVDRTPKHYEDLVSGVISCRIIVKDKLALPDHEHAKAGNIKGAQYDFYKIGNTPVIPGSEIRGCIRSIYETLTGSCYSVINSNTLTKRVSVAWKDIASPCIVKYEDDGWYLYPAKKLSKEERENGSRGIMRRWKSAPKLEQENPKLKFMTQFYAAADENAEGIPCTNKMDGFKEIIAAYLKNNRENTEFIKCIEMLRASVEAKKPFVAFYQKKQGKITYFSPAQLGGRTAYENTVTDLLGEYAPCKEINALCPACDLFGTITKKSAALASKIRFSDALPVREIQLSDYAMLPPLSSPKTTSVEFYSKNGEALTDVERWNYDSDGVELRGRKYYFHSRAKTAKTGEPLITGQFATRTAPAESEFRFSVFFDNVSKSEQLGKLLYCLTLGENSANSDHMQKIGAGKSVGYGSVKIVVDRIAVRTTENMKYSVSYPEYETLAADENAFDKVALKTLKTISNYNYVLHEKVSYPSAPGGAFKWFAANRPPKTAVFRYVLPKITDSPEGLRMPSVNYSDEEEQDKPVQKTFPTPSREQKNKSFGESRGKATGKDIRRQTGFGNALLCPVCKTNNVEINSITDKPFATCRECFAKAPVCPVCRTRKRSFNRFAGKYYNTCAECSK